jgi:hypothetical protein
MIVLKNLMNRKPTKSLFFAILKKYFTKWNKNGSQNHVKVDWFDGYKKLKGVQHYCSLAKFHQRIQLKMKNMKMKLFLGVSITRSQEKKKRGKFVILPNLVCASSQQYRTIIQVLCFIDGL